ncbi:MoaD/ThiS family protein [Acidobacteriota bacterium]
MKITVEFLSMPIITKVIGSKSVTLSFSGSTVDDLLSHITNKYGEKVRRFLLDDTGKLDMTLKILLNKKEWIPRERFDRCLGDGDLVTIMMLVGGG